MEALESNHTVQLLYSPNESLRLTVEELVRGGFDPDDFEPTS
jgi:hypothetical protein